MPNHSIKPQDDHEETTILVFGPQFRSNLKAGIGELRSALSKAHDWQWATDAIEELPDYWETIANKQPGFAHLIPSKGIGQKLKSLLRHGLHPDDEVSDFPNAVITPLVVLTHLTQYWQFLQEGRRKNRHLIVEDVFDLQKQLVQCHDHGRQHFKSVGFCTGMLTAFVVACSHNSLDFQGYGAVAIRLAMIIGGLIDAQDVRNVKQGHGRSKQYTAVWHDAVQEANMNRILESIHPQAYLSVRYDESRATITASETSAPHLLQQLQHAGITTVEIESVGYFHSPSKESADDMEALIKLCSIAPSLRLPCPADLALPSFSNRPQDMSILPKDKGLQETAIRSIIVDECDWYRTFVHIHSCHSAKPDRFVSFGPTLCVPPSLKNKIAEQITDFRKSQAAPSGFSGSDIPNGVHTPVASPPIRPIDRARTEEDSIAVIGMSIKVAGADDLNEFSQMLQTGESQHETIGPDRMVFDTLFRAGNGTQRQAWYGNFLRDVDSFDYKFFKRSPRESTTMDPQQRLFLQAAYQAVEQSGYFNRSALHSEKYDRERTGVYVGACAGDYEHHVACHDPNAFTATGNRKSFLSGKISHHFGWTGPSMTFDTACSASAVAIHTACRDLLSDDCTAALVGGVATMSNILWFQNLAAASFLSPTGQCKPFDEKADGYCRAEGIASVFLMRESVAIAERIPILGCIASTAINQNQNCTPLFVPNSPSLSSLFEIAIKKAKVRPDAISVVEAHGTGTPVGDPVEYDSIRAVLAGPSRPDNVFIGSVKGHIGHTEGASGIISLIKIIMMMQDGYIPPQASFSTMSHHIRRTSSDMMEVATSLRSWDQKDKAVLINNYGASGSNASMVVKSFPLPHLALAAGSIRDKTGESFPFWISGSDLRSVGAYSAKLADYVRQRPQLSLADLSHSVSRQSNRSLPHSSIFSVRSLEELMEKLSEGAKNRNSFLTVGTKSKEKRPLILCFGGQVGTCIGLDRKLHDSISILRHHLECCDSIMTSLGLGSLYPEIFSRSPIQDQVKIQTMLFAVQYACARSWLDYGLSDHVVAVVGHSFGEITALCISGSVTLLDTIKLVAGRVQLVRDTWGPHPGAMEALEGDIHLVHELLDDSNRAYGGIHPAVIACYNGPRSFTIAGSVEAIAAVVANVKNNPRFAGIRSKRLGVTNAYHSTFVEPLLEDLRAIGSRVTFKKPSVHLNGLRNRDTSVD